MMRIDADLTFDGDILKSARFKRGSQVRPLWARMERLLPHEMIQWVDRFDSLCPIASEWALAQALEIAMNVSVHKRVQFVRALLCELNRLVWLTTYLGRLSESLGQRTLMQQVFVLRENVFVMQEELTGGRILPQALNIGGLRREFAMGDVQKVKTFLGGWKSAWESWVELVAGDPLLEERLSGLMIIPPAIVERLGWWGIVGKASGVNYDARKHRPFGPYPFLDFELVSRSRGDAKARFEVAVDEIHLTIKLLEQILKSVPVEIETPKNPEPLAAGFFFGTAESAKGPVTAALEVSQSGFVAAVRLFAPGQRAWPVLEPLFQNIRAEDFKLAFVSLGIDSEESEI